MMHITVVNKMFERAINEKSLTPAEVLAGLNKAAVQLHKLNEATDGDYKDYVAAFDRKNLRKAWAEVKKTSLVRKGRCRKSSVRIMRDVLVGLVVDQGLSLKNVADRAIVLVAETGGKTQRKRYSKANQNIVAYLAALVEDKATTKPAQ